jgi:hypothetical protein
MDNRFRITMSFEAVSAGLELWSDFLEVVNLAVEDDRDLVVFA